MRSERAAGPIQETKSERCKKMKQYNICLAKVPQPPKDCTGEPVINNPVPIN